MEVLRHIRAFAAAAALVAAAGCASYEIVQSNIFSDDDGNIVSVSYGRSASPQTSTFVNPATGKETEFKSNLVVEVTLPDGESFTAWQCMNFMRQGTMYGADGGKWRILVNGFSCVVYVRRGDGGYDAVYHGILCETAGDGPKKKDNRWRTMKKDANGGWR